MELIQYAPQTREVWQEAVREQAIAYLSPKRQHARALRFLLPRSPYSQSPAGDSADLQFAQARRRHLALEECSDLDEVQPGRAAQSPADGSRVLPEAESKMPPHQNQCRSVLRRPRSRTLHPRSMTRVRSAAVKFIPPGIAAALGGTVSEMFPDFAEIRLGGWLPCMNPCMTAVSSAQVSIKFHAIAHWRRSSTIHALPDSPWSAFRATIRGNARGPAMTSGKSTGQVLGQPRRRHPPRSRYRVHCPEASRALRLRSNLRQFDQPPSSFASTRPWRLPRHQFSIPPAAKPELVPSGKGLINRWLSTSIY